MKIHLMEQGSEEWDAVRKGKMTASKAQAIASMGKGLDTYVQRIAAEHLSLGTPSSYSNESMARGIELESDARTVYGRVNNAMVEQVGFIEYSDFVGCSPDGLVGDDGGIEVKCLEDLAHFKLITDGAKGISSGHQWQCQANLLITGRQWWDYVAYNPNYEHLDKHLWVFRIYPDLSMHDKLKMGFDLGEAKIKALLSKFQS